MALAPQNDHESPRLEGRSASSNDSAEDALCEAPISSVLRAHLQNFTYSSTVPISKTAIVPQAEFNFNASTRTNAKRGTKTMVKLEPRSPPRRASRKRSSKLDVDKIIGQESPAKKRNTTKQRSANDPYSPTNNLVDSIRPGLMLVFIGLNPGLTTAATGHAYSHPSNLFWKLLEWSGVTPKRHLPSETHDLMDLYLIGNTNICARPTRSGNGLSKEELADGAILLEAKISKYKPEAVCIVGKSIWEAIYKSKKGKQLKPRDFSYGWQAEDLQLGRTLTEGGEIEWAGAKTFVTTTTSGLAASMKPQEKLEVWKPLGAWLNARRGIAVKTEDDIKAEEDF